MSDVRLDSERIRGKLTSVFQRLDPVVFALGAAHESYVTVSCHNELAKIKRKIFLANSERRTLLLFC